MAKHANPRVIPRLVLVPNSMISFSDLASEYGVRVHDCVVAGPGFMTEPGDLILHIRMDGKYPDLTHMRRNEDRP